MMETPTSTNNVTVIPAILTCKEISLEFKEQPMTSVFLEQAENCCLEVSSGRPVSPLKVTL